MPMSTRRCSCRSAALDYSSYVGRIGVGKIIRGRVKTGQNVMVMFGTEEEAAEHDRSPIKAKIGQVFGYKGLNKVEMEEGLAGDIVQITGIEDLVLGLHCDRPGSAGSPAAAQDRRADPVHAASWSTPARWPAPKASSSPAARSATACTRNC